MMQRSTQERRIMQRLISNEIIKVRRCIIMLQFDNNEVLKVFLKFDICTFVLETQILIIEYDLASCFGGFQIPSSFLRIPRT
jgi:hypothetical protein